MNTEVSGISEWMHAVCFTDINNGIAAGWGGILKTTDSGVSWFQQSAGTTEQLWGVFFTDEINGTAVGSNGTIIRTPPLGWIQQNSGTTYILEGVSFIDENTGWVSGYAGTIMKTTNGGLTWVQQYSGSSFLHDIKSPQSGFVWDSTDTRCL